MHSNRALYWLLVSLLCALNVSVRAQDIPAESRVISDHDLMRAAALVGIPVEPTQKALGWPQVQWSPFGWVADPPVDMPTELDKLAARKSLLLQIVAYEVNKITAGGRYYVYFPVQHIGAPVVNDFFEETYVSRDPQAQDRPMIMGALQALPSLATTQANLSQGVKDWVEIYLRDHAKPDPNGLSFDDQAYSAMQKDESGPQFRPLDDFGPGATREIPENNAMGLPQRVFNMAVKWLIQYGIKASASAISEAMLDKVLTNPQLSSVNFFFVFFYSSDIAADDLSRVREIEDGIAASHAAIQAEFMREGEARAGRSSRGGGLVDRNTPGASPSSSAARPAGQERAAPITLRAGSESSSGSQSDVQVGGPH